MDDRAVRRQGRHHVCGRGHDAGFGRCRVAAVAALSRLRNGIGEIMSMTASPRSDTTMMGKVVVVTGAARGIGRASAVALAKAGAETVVGIDIDGAVSGILDFAPAAHEDLAETGRQVEQAGARWMQIRLDQRNIALLRQAAETVEQSCGGIDVLFANAGIQAFKPLLEMEDADWHDQIDVNLNGTANALRAFAPALVRRGEGRIIITSSTQGQQGTKNGSSYSASKWGLIGLMKSVALELGSHRITVNALIPGLIDTRLTRHEDRYAAALAASGQEPSGDEARDEEAAKQAQLKKTPLGVPWIVPEDVAPMVVFLASDAARMISGSMFEVTGGVSAQLTA